MSHDALFRLFLGLPTSTPTPNGHGATPTTSATANTGANPTTTITHIPFDKDEIILQLLRMNRDLANELAVAKAQRDLFEKAGKSLFLRSRQSDMTMMGAMMQRFGQGHGGVGGGTTAEDRGGVDGRNGQRSA